MASEKTITINGKKVGILYQFATEMAFENMTGQSIAKTNFELQENLLKLCLAAILAYAQKHDEEPTLTSDDIMFGMESKADVQTLINAVVECQKEWYEVPQAEQNANKSNVEDEDDEKN